MRKNIKLLCRILTAALIWGVVWNMSFGVVVSEAAETPNNEASDQASGTSGGINWRIDKDGKLTVEGTGDYELIDDEPPWYSYSDDITSAEVSIRGITNVRKMFNHCENMTSVDLSELDTAKVTNMEYMFFDCKSLTSLDLSSFDTTNVTAMYDMFNRCKNLTSLDLSSFDTAKVTTMAYMFYYCENLTSLDLGSFDATKISGCSSMFSGCSSLIKLQVPVNVVTDIVLPSVDNGEKWYMGETEVTYLPKGLKESTLLERRLQGSNPTNPDQSEVEESKPNKPGQQLPNTLAEYKSGFHIIIFCVLTGLTAYAYGLKQKYE